MVSQAQTIQIRLTPRQTDAWEVFERPSCRELLYGGAKWGGKTYFGCIWSYVHALQIADQFHVPVSAHPLAVGFMGRRRSTDFNKTTFETWRQLWPENSYEHHIQAQEIVIGQRVKIFYGGFDDREAVNKFNSMRIGFAFIDQAEEVPLDGIAMVRGNMLLLINGQRVEPKLLLTANPRKGWVRDDFILSPKAHRSFVRALPSDNPFISAADIAMLRDAFEGRPELLKALLEGSWDDLEGAYIVIKDQWLRNALSRTIFWPKTTRLITCDPAAMGDDETVCYYLENTDIKAAEFWSKKNAMESAGLIKTMSAKHNCKNIILDGTGGLRAIGDRLNELGTGLNVVNLEMSALARDPARCINVRAEMWFAAAQRLSSGDISMRYEEPVLFGQLTTPEYVPHSTGRVQIEGKEDIKKRLGRSPDRADAYVMGLYGLSMFDPDVEATKGKSQKYQEPSQVDAMAM